MLVKITPFRLLFFLYHFGNAIAARLHETRLRRSEKQ
jgi:hypothetical protein